MKFCYIDESGTGREPFGVMVGIIVDASRMHVTKSDWDALLKVLSRLTRRSIPEIHTCDFYRGNSIWRGLSGELRSRVTTEVFQWLNERKHHIICTAVDKGHYNEKLSAGSMKSGIDSVWKCLGLHLVLGIQKASQSEKNNKGNTVLIFDKNDCEGHQFSVLIDNPPAWTDEYYGRDPNSNRLDQIIDVPFYADSRHASLIQIADFSAFFIRRYIELTSGVTPPLYRGEERKISEWIELLCQRHINHCATYPARGRNDAQEFFWSLAPDCIRNMD